MMSDETTGAAGGLYFAFRGRDLLVLLDDAGHAVPRHEHWRGLDLSALRTNEVGTVGGLRAFAVELPEDAEPPAGAEFLNLRRLYGSLTDDVYRMAGRAVQVVEWDRSHQFCGRCGTPTERVEGEMAKRCPRCGRRTIRASAPPSSCAWTAATASSWPAGRTGGPARTACWRGSWSPASRWSRPWRAR